MRGLFLIFLCWTFAVSSAFAQGTPSAGLAAAGAAAALGASGQGGTTPSSVAGAAGGGSSAIEVQTIALKGLEQIARDLSTIVENAKPSCEHGLTGQLLDENVSAMEGDTLKLEADMSNATTDPSDLQTDRKKLEEDLQKFDELSRATRS